MGYDIRRSGNSSQTRGLVLFEDAGRCFVFSSMPVVSSSSPCVFRVKTEVCVPRFSRFRCVFWETLSAVNWLARCGLKRDRCGFAAFSAFDFKHSFFQLVCSPLFSWGWNWKCKLTQMYSEKFNCQFRFDNRHTWMIQSLLTLVQSHGSSHRRYN